MTNTRVLSFLVSASLTLTTAGHAVSARIEEARRLAAENNEVRIVGGVPVALTERPWQIALVLPEEPDDFRAQFCGGVLIATQWVVTAAHCVDDGTMPSEVQVLFGSDQLDGTGNRVNVRAITVHPAWSSSTHDSDVALLALAGAIRSQPPADLASKQQLDAAIELRVSGWGKTAEFFGLRSKQLLAVSLPLVSNADCNQPDSYAGNVTANMVCAGRVQGGQDSCQGDSGGPATIDHGGTPLLAGLVSWGSGCGRAKKYGVYTRLPIFTPWLEGVMANGE